MDEYTHGDLYTGNIVKVANNEQIILQENVMFIYDGQQEIFYGIEVLNHLLDLETNQDLSTKKKEEYQRIVNENTYLSCSRRNDNKPYIDKESIKPFSPKEKKQKTR